MFCLLPLLMLVCLKLVWPDAAWAQSSGAPGYTFLSSSPPYNLNVTLWSEGFGLDFFSMADPSHDRYYVTDWSTGSIHVLSLTNGSRLFDIPPLLPTPLFGPSYSIEVSQPGAMAIPPPFRGQDLLLVTDAEYQFLSVFNITSRAWAPTICHVPLPVEDYNDYAFGMALDQSDNAFVFLTYLSDSNDGKSGLVMLANASSQPSVCSVVNTTIMNYVTFVELAIDNTNHVLWLLDTATAQLIQMAANASFAVLRTIPLVGTNSFRTLTVGNDSIVYLANTNVILGFSVNGSQVFSATYNAGVPNPRSYGVSLRPDGSFLLTQDYDHSISHVSRNGTLLGLISSQYASPAYFAALAVQPGVDILWIGDFSSLTAANTTTQRIITTTLTAPLGGGDAYLAADSGTYVWRLVEAPDYSGRQMLRVRMANLSDVFTVPGVLGDQFTGVAVLPNGTFVYLLDQSVGLISRFTSAGQNDTTWTASLSQVAGQDLRSLALDRLGRLYLCFNNASSGTGTVYRVEVNRTTTPLNITVSYCQTVTIDANFTVYVSTSSDNFDGEMLVAFTSAGQALWQFQTDPYESYLFALAVDSHGTVYTGGYSVGVFAISPSLTPSSTAAVRGDPQFVGLRGQSYQVHGIDGAVYSLISDDQLAVNARFGFLSSPRLCPSYASVQPWSAGEQPTAISCWSHDGSYLTELGFLTPSQRLLVRAGSAANGFVAVELNGRSIASVAGDVMEGDVQVRVLSRHQLTVRVGSFEVRVENSDGFVNLAGVSVLQPLTSLRCHGLLGQTWKRPDSSTGTADSSLRAVVEGEVDDYVIPNEELFGTDFIYSQYNGSKQVKQ